MNVETASSQVTEVLPNPLIETQPLDGSTLAARLASGPLFTSTKTPCPNNPSGLSDSPNTHLSKSESSNTNLEVKVSCGPDSNDKDLSNQVHKRLVNKPAWTRDYVMK